MNALGKKQALQSDVDSSAALPLTGCATLGKALYLSVSRFSKALGP